MHKDIMNVLNKKIMPRKVEPPTKFCPDCDQHTLDCKTCNGKGEIPND